MHRSREAKTRKKVGAHQVAIVLALGPLCGLSVFGDEPRFDGVWQTTLSCENSSGALGYSFRFPSTVKNGVLHGEKGTVRQPGWLQIDGSVNADGTADLYVEGLVGAAPFAVGQLPAGTAYGYHVDAKFSGENAEGHRVEGRPCTVTWTR